MVTPDEVKARRAGRCLMRACDRSLAAIAALCIAAPVTAQSGLALPGPTLSGESGVYAESYRNTGRAVRRPAATLRAYASPSFSWLGLTISSNFLLSTEDRFVAQTMNRYYVNPRWSWGQLHAGDYVPEVSRYTASAAHIRGGGVELTPGPFRFALAGGRAQVASNLSTFDAAPSRLLVSGLLGVGDRSRTFVELSVLRAEDSRAGSDTLSAPPQENLVAGIATGMTMRGGAVTVRGETSGSLFSRDTRASALGITGMPEWTARLFTPRISSRADYAWMAEARLNSRRASIGGQLEYVGPGFTTLGNPFFQNDRREYRALGSLRAFNGRLGFSGSLGQRRDNLAGDKRGTTRRTTGTAAVTATAGSWLVSTAMLMMNDMRRVPDLARRPTDPDPGVQDSFRLANVTVAVSVTEQIRFRLWGLPHQFTVSAAEQRVSDDSPRFGALLDATSRSASAEYGLTIGGLYLISVRPMWQSFKSAQGTEEFRSVSLGINRRAPRSPFSASMSSTITPVTGGQQMRHDLGGAYRLSARDALSWQLRYTDLSGTARAYTETIATVRLTHRW